MQKQLKRFAALVLLLVLCLAGCVAPTDPTLPSVTTSTTNAADPTQGGDPMPEKTVYYCAVGSVDESAKTAKVLFGNGEVKTIKWEGDAPEVGMVNPFVKNGDVYTAQRVKTYPVFSDSFATRDPVYASGRQKRFWYSDMYFMNEESIIFVRYSDTEWRVFKGREALAFDAYAKIYLYSENELDGLAKVVRYGMVVGNYAAKGKWPAADKTNTAFLDTKGEGWDHGDIDLS